MADLTLEAANRMGNWTFVNGSTPTRPTFPLNVALFSVMPDPQTGLGGTELSGNGYARATIAFSAFASGATSNSSDATFPAATGAPWTTVGVVVYDTAGTPVPLMSGTFPATVTVAVGQTFKIVQGALVILLG